MNTLLRLSLSAGSLSHIPPPHDNTLPPAATARRPPPSPLHLTQLATTQSLHLTYCEGDSRHLIAHFAAGGSALWRPPCRSHYEIPTFAAPFIPPSLPVPSHHLRFSCRRTVFSSSSNPCSLWEACLFAPVS